MVAYRRTMKANHGRKGDDDMALASSPVKNDRIDIRMTRELKEKLQRAAELEGVTLSSFLVQSAVERADDVLLRNDRIIELSQTDQEAFIDWMLDPPKPTEKLIDALRYHERELAKR